MFVLALKRGVHVTGANPHCRWEDHHTLAAWLQWRSLGLTAMKIAGAMQLLPRGSCEHSWSRLAVGSSLLQWSAVAWGLLESANTSSLHLHLVQPVAVESIESLALRMPISYTLPVSQARPNEDGRCYVPCLLARWQVARRLALRVKLLCGKFPQWLRFILWSSKLWQYMAC
jgi:hypothetical protein